MPFTSFANNFVHHVIVLIDRSGSMDGPNDNNKKKIKSFKRIIKKDLDEFCFKPGKFFANRKLLDNTMGDRLSVISWGLTLKNPTFKNFIHPIHITKGQFKENIHYISNYDQQFFSTSLKDTIDRYKYIKEKFFSFRWTALTASIPLGVYSLKDSSHFHNIHRTIVIQISDDIPNTEKEKVKVAPEALWRDELKSLTMAKEMNWAINVCNSFFQHYDIKPLDQTETPIKIKVMELVPKIAKTFEIESALSYDHHKALFSRTRKGFQLSNYFLDPINKDTYLITQSEANLIDDDQNIIEQIDLGRIENQKQLRFTLEKSSLTNGISHINMRFRVLWKEDTYGVQVLYPEQTKGLERNIPVVFEKQKKFWLVMPLTDVIFNLTFMSSQNNAVILLNIVGVFLACFIVFIIPIFLIRAHLNRDMITEDNLRLENINFF